MVNQNAIAKMVYDLSAGKKRKELYNHPQAQWVRDMGRGDGAPGGGDDF